MALQTDYLVIGAGMSGLAFADELLNHTKAHITIVDKRAAPGGHWNDSYPFVKLHQPSVFYGVGSTELTPYRIDSSGPNAGFLSLAEGPEITAYCHNIMRERLLPSGQVTYLPLTSYEPDSTLRGLLSGARQTVTVNKKIVNAAYYTNNIPLTHKRNFTVEDGQVCVPPNYLPRHAADFSHFTILGAGKTAIDACIWLLTNNAPPESITWVIPRDSWFINRAKIQPGIEFFDEVFSNAADQRDDLANATSLDDLALRFEASGSWLRLDRNIKPAMFHAATISEGELAQLRRILDLIRIGRLRSITANTLEFEKGERKAVPGTLYIDCTASALPDVPLLPVFNGNRITIQVLRFPMIPFSAALIAFLEVMFSDDNDKSKLASPVPFPYNLEDYLQTLKTDMENRVQHGRDPLVRDWIARSRLDGYTAIAQSIDAADEKKQNILNRARQSGKPAYLNLQRLIASTAQ